jgi:hypothetical protein
MDDKDNKQMQVKSVKKKWVTPEILDLDVNLDTQNAGSSGPTAPDGGVSFSDYNS